MTDPEFVSPHRKAAKKIEVGQGSIGGEGRTRKRQAPTRKDLG